MEESYSNFLTGVGGVLYPPYSLHKEVVKEKIFMKLCPKADDIWFWAMAVKQKTKIRVVPNPQVDLNYVPGSQNNGLLQTNCLDRGNDLQLDAVLKHYPLVLKCLENERIPFIKIFLFGLPVWIRHKKAKNINSF